MSNDVILKLRKTVPSALESISPDIRASRRVRELDVDPNASACPTYAPLKNVSDAQFLPDLACADRLSLVRESSVAGYHEAPGDTGQVRCKIVGETLSQVILLRVAAQIREGQDDDGQVRR